jgi:aminoglycoside/choline kinase family phosphotransferase
MNNRAAARTDFLQREGLGDAEIVPITGDASFRSYYRVKHNGKTYVLMDAPPERPEEDTRPFIAIDRHLAKIGLSVPEIYAEDVGQGFLLLEDFGDDTYPALLDAGADPLPLFTAATDALIHLHQNQRAIDIDLPHVGPDKWIERALLLVDWYLPPEARDASCREGFIAAWQEIFASLPAPRLSLVHRDYAAQNFMALPHRGGYRACGIIDFQDAEIGPAAYDLASQLWDPRRDIPAPVVTAMLARYDAALPMDEGFRSWLYVLRAQRACRIMGVFVRLSVRDGKHHYRAFLPRLEGYLTESLNLPELAPLRGWAEEYLPHVILSGLSGEALAKTEAKAKSRDLNLDFSTSSSFAGLRSK